MSDGAIATIVSGVVTLGASIVGFLTLWMKMRYGADKAKEIEEKLDVNTEITQQSKDASTKASEHGKLCDEERARTLNILADHGTRISLLEGQMSALKISIEAATKNVDSTRHEMRGHLQTINTKLDLMAMVGSAGTGKVLVAGTPVAEKAKMSPEK